MTEIEVIRTSPLELPAKIARRFSAMTDVSSMKDFFVYVYDKENKMYVNPSVPQEDVEKFIEVVMFPDYFVNDDYDGMGVFLDHVYCEYGYPAYANLLESHSRRIEREEARRAKEMKDIISPLIEKITMGEYLDIPYDEMLIYEIRNAGLEGDRRTRWGKISYGDVYTFYLGCIVGNYAINPADPSLKKKIQGIRKHLKKMYFSDETQEGGAS